MPFPILSLLQYYLFDVKIKRQYFDIVIIALFCDLSAYVCTSFSIMSEYKFSLINFAYQYPLLKRWRETFDDFFLGNTRVSDAQCCTAPVDSAVHTTSCCTVWYQRCC